MKKTVLFLAILAAFVGAHAQTTIPNGDFEMWSYGKPVGWTPGILGNLNVSSYANLPIEVNFCTEANDTHSGNKAVKITSGELAIPYVGFSFVIPGFLQVGEAEGFNIPMQDFISIIQMFQDTTNVPVIDSSSLAVFASLLKVLSPGIPCPSTPRYVTLWAKYQPQENDTMAVIAMTKRNGELVDFAHKQFFNLDPNNYEKIAVEFENPNAPSDSIMIIIFSSTALNSTSVLYVDDVQLEYGVDVPVVEIQHDKIYPNPASDVLFLQLDNDQPCKWTLRDLTGRTLKSGTVTGKTSIDVKQYPSGVYMLTLNIGGQESTRKVVIR